ncbi:MAG: hypothetical protein KatS3mg082_2081 [Nitrospiraceae bacterium]|nr:MAG: hypothetical protein KatS3mg082_2081 [Nitrospiraceae bacterium]
MDVYIGSGRFTGPGTIQVEGPAGNRTLRFAKAALCTGATRRSATHARIGRGGISDPTRPWFWLTELPRRLAVIGAGPDRMRTGSELSPASAAGCTSSKPCTAFCRTKTATQRDIVQQSMARDGVTLLCCGKDLNVGKTDGGKRLTVDSHGQRYDIAVDEILVGVGRAPNVEGLGLETVGVEYDRTGVKVNSRLQTTNPRIYAAGDVCSRYKFTHAADAMAQIVIQNALFPHPFGLAYASADSLTIPWCTYTEPEIAHVGMYEAEAKTKGLQVETYTYRLDEVDRAILDGEEEGFARVHIQKGTDKILGATIVAAHAGDLISEFTALMKAGAGAKTLAGTIHPYPTQAEVNKKVVNLWRKAHFTEGQKRMLKRWFEWTRKG